MVMPQLEVGFFPSQILWLLITFGVLYFYVQSFIVPKIGGIVSKRQDFIKETLEEIKRLDAQIKTLHAECANEVLATRNKVEEIHAKMLEEFNNIKRERINAVDKKSEAMYAKFLNEFSSELKGKNAADFAASTIDTASYILNKAIGVVPQMKLLTECYDELDKSDVR